jgi:hypothetical protein
VTDFEKISNALALHRNMALCGEQPSATSDGAYAVAHDALNSLRARIAEKDAALHEAANALRDASKGFLYEGDNGTADNLDAAARAARTAAGG